MKIVKFLSILFFISFSLAGRVLAFNECAYITTSCALSALYGPDKFKPGGCTPLDEMKKELNDQVNQYIIFNNRDENEDGFNDYAMWASPVYDYEQLEDDISRAGTDEKDVRLIVLRAMLSPCGDNPADYDIDPLLWDAASLDELSLMVAVDDPEHILHNYDKVGRLPGCIDNGDGSFSGWTYQIYRKNHDPKHSEACSSSTSLMIYDNLNDEITCINKGGREQMDINSVIPGWNQFTVEARPHGALICAKAVLCEAFGLVFSVNGTDNDNEAKIDCGSRIGENECDADGDGFHEEECTENNIESHYSNRCSLCIDRSKCLDSEGYYNEASCREEESVCGKYYNPYYLAHCVLDESSVDEIVQGSVVPHFVSSYCTGAAEYTDDIAFVGRIMRCVEYTMNNIMFGATEVVADKKIEQIICAEDGRVVQFQSQCNSGMLQKFQAGVKSIVTLAMVLSVTLIGFNILFGAGGDYKNVFKQVFIFALVGYFAIGDAWRDGYYLALQSLGNELGSIIINAIDYAKVEGVQDQSGHIIYDVEVDKCKYNEETRTGPFSIQYSEARDWHYSIWDMYDCKFKNFIESDNIVPGSPATYGQILRNSLFNFALFLFPIALGASISLFLIYLSFKVAFYAVTSFMAIMVLLFISPVVIPLALFKHKKVKGIFDEWLSHILGYSLVPLILAALIAMTFLVFDYSLYGTSGDVLQLDDNGNVGVSDNCLESYLPCLYHRLAEGHYKATTSFMGYKFKVYPTEFFRHYLVAVLRLFLMILVMTQVFSAALSQMAQNVLGVEMVKEKIWATMLSTMGSIANNGASFLRGGGARASSFAGAVKRKLSKKGDSSYDA